MKKKKQRKKERTSRNYFASGLEIPTAHSSMDESSPHIIVW